MRVNNLDPLLIVVSRRFLNPPILWRLPYIAYSSIFHKPFFNIDFVTLFLWLNVWTYHIECIILLNDMMDLHLLNLAILVLEAPFYVFYGTSHQVYCKFDTDIIAFLITLIWYLIQTNTHIWHQKGLGGVKTSDNLFLEHFPYFTIPSLLFLL